MTKTPVNIEDVAHEAGLHARYAEKCRLVVQLMAERQALQAQKDALSAEVAALRARVAEPEKQEVTDGAAR